MKPERLLHQIYQYLNARGYYARTVLVSHVDELKKEIALKYEMGFLDDTFFQERLTSFQWDPLTIMKEAESILLIAVPQPVIALIFHWQGVDHVVNIPPTYDVSVNTALKDYLEDILRPEGYHLASLLLPLKLLIVRCGLAAYGRNNICYIKGKGSFFRLMAFITDLPCIEDNWRAPEMMERCLNCRACIVACPTGAIDENRFLLHAERCLAFHNEHAGDFPKDLDRSLHHCLFGCLLCQKVCPENRKSVKWVEERERFSENETLAILRGVPLEQIPAMTQKKLDRLGLTDDYSLLARNLGLLLT